MCVYWNHLQEEFAEVSRKLAASQAECSALSGQLEFLENKLASLRGQMEEV